MSIYINEDQKLLMHELLRYENEQREQWAGHGMSALSPRSYYYSTWWFGGIGFTAAEARKELKNLESAALVVGDRAYPNNTRWHLTEAGKKALEAA